MTSRNLPHPHAPCGEGRFTPAGTYTDVTG